jgi:hypothetical protein
MRMWTGSAEWRGMRDTSAQVQNADAQGPRSAARSTPRWLLVIVTLSLTLTFSGCSVPWSRFSASPASSTPTGSARPGASPIIAENEKTGTDEWKFGSHDYSGVGPEMQGFTAPASVNVGEDVQLFASTTAATYSFKVFRMGWYQGVGARLLYTSQVLPGIRQPAPLFDKTTRTVSASNWTHPATISVGKDWVSGFYLIKMYSSVGYVQYAVFVVRDDSRPATMLMQMSFLTYQAYNIWGGFSLYRGIDATGKMTGDGRSYKVSFDRPYSDYFGIGNLGYSELNMIRWMEKQGYDLSYTTDMDVHARGSLLTQHQMIVIPGHDEYWSTAMRQNVTAARDHGVSLAFFSANNIYWHVRLEDSPLGENRIEVCYRYTNIDPEAGKNPQEATVRWRNEPLDNPEATLIGQQYAGIISTPGAFVLSDGAKPFFAGTSLQSGSSFPGMADGEYDRVAAPPIYPSQIILTASPVQCTSADCPSTGHDVANSIIYAPPGGGGRVFDAGSFYWAAGLDDLRLTEKGRAVKSNEQFQRFTANVIAYLLTGSIPKTS